MGVLFTSSSVNFSSSKATVKMAPGGVHVPIIKWCTGIVQKLSLSPHTNFRAEIAKSE
jgi:hypothetical protein